MTEPQALCRIIRKAWKDLATIDQDEAEQVLEAFKEALAALEAVVDAPTGVTT
jgi:hypothetical protein